MIDRVKEVDSLDGLLLDGAWLGEPVEGTDTGREVVERREVRQIAAGAAEHDLTQVNQAVDGVLDGGEAPRRRPLPMFHLAVVLEKGDVVDCRLNAEHAHVIRNAGGRASDDAIRSLIISYKLLGTREWFVVHHADCGMLLFTNDDMRDLLASSLKTVTLDQSGWRDSGEGSGSPGVRVEQATLPGDPPSCAWNLTRTDSPVERDGFEPSVPG